MGLQAVIWLRSTLTALLCLIATAAQPWWQSVQQVSVGSAPAAMSAVLASASSQYLTTTWSHAPTDGTKATISLWAKYTVAPSGNKYIFTTAATSSTILDFKFAFGNLQVSDDSGGVYNVSNADPAGDTNWHHYLVQIDTNQATAANRIIVYFDGVSIAVSGTFPTLGSNPQVTANTILSYLGIVSYQIGGSTSNYSDVKFAYVYLIDGQALPPSSFTTGTGAGSIHPAAYGGTFGANGFFLNGSGSSLNDQSGNGNNWTAPFGVAFDADVPT